MSKERDALLSALESVLDYAAQERADALFAALRTYKQKYTRSWDSMTRGSTLCADMLFVLDSAAGYAEAMEAMHNEGVTR
jgi:hypothetical protein